jgi:hypothetical protein
MFNDPKASHSRPGDDQKDPLSFQQLLDMHVSCHLSQQARHLEDPNRGTHPGGKESLVTTLRSLMTTHFLAWRAVVTCSLERLSSATCDLVRSSSRKILMGSEKNLRLALRAQSRSVVDLNWREWNQTQPALYRGSQPEEKKCP